MQAPPPPLPFGRTYHDFLELCGCIRRRIHAVAAGGGCPVGADVSSGIFKVWEALEGRGGEALEEGEGRGRAEVKACI